MTKSFNAVVIIFLLFKIINLNAQSYYTKSNNETNLSSFTTINGQWNASNPINNSLGVIHYQGLNFGFDVNNYATLVNGVDSSDLYFGRWSGNWKGWRKIVMENGGGYVGIGTPNPSYKLDVIGSAGIGSESVNANTTKMFLRNPAGKTWAISSGANMVTESSFSIYNWTDNQNSPYFHMDVNGNIGIGTIAPDTKLAVNGTIHTKEVKVDLQSPMSVPDYVFEKDYKLRSLQETEDYIKENKHLPEIPSAQEIEKNGLMLAEMNMHLLKKIEELTLYSIEQNKKIDEQAKEIESLKDLVLRVAKIEKELSQK